MDKRIQILDCTLRDGGFGFEDAALNEPATKYFSSDGIDTIIKHLERSRLDIIELGAVELSTEDKRRFAIYQNLESISETMPKTRTDHQMYAALYRGPDTPIEDIPVWNPSYCEAVRVIIRYSELQKSLDFCKALARKGYQVFVQPMLTMRYTEVELQMLIDAANDMSAYALYFVDSYGYMQTQDITCLFQRFNTGLDPAVRIGFHAHNNTNLAFANALTFIAQPTERGIIIDSCALGLGQGAGNLQTEIIANYMIRTFGADYHYASVLEVCELIEHYWTQNLWGYSVTHLLPALHKTAYKYATSLRNRYGLSFPEIDSILQDMPDHLRQRYTPENTAKVLELCGHPIQCHEGKQ